MTGSKFEKAKPQMDPMRNRKEFYENVSSEKNFRENTDWISTGNTERDDVLMLDVFVLNASVCTVKTCSQTSSSETWETEEQPTA